MIYPNADKFTNLIKHIDIAVERANEMVDKAADAVMKKYLKSLKEKYHNHHFVYSCGMGVRSLEVYDKAGNEVASIDGYGIDWKKAGFIQDRDTPYDDMVQFMKEFISACEQDVYFDAEETPKPDFVAMKLEKMHGRG